MIHPIHAIVLAAGMSSRFGTHANKLIVPICGKPLIMHAIDILEKANIPTTIVVGHQKELVKETITKHSNTPITFATQEKQNGTGHAVMCSRTHWDSDHILILNGDMPLLTQDIITTLINEHIKNDATVTFVAALPDKLDHAYGRVIEKDGIIEIIEARDFIGDKTKQHPISAGVYLFKRNFLETYLDTLSTNNANNELYLTDLIAIAGKQKQKAIVIRTPFDLIRGVNTQEEFYTAQYLKRMHIIGYFMHHGVQFADPHTVYIDANVTIEPGTIIGSHVHILGGTTIAANCTIHPFSIINNAQIESHAKVGPFAHIRNNTHLKNNAVVGNFVEIKNSTIGAHSKAKHLSYIGDTDMGDNVNVGAGTITCNYDGTNKHRTTIQNNVFIGSNNTLVAPVTIEHDAYTAAGSTITKNVSSEALAIARAPQINKEKYAQRLREKINHDSTQKTNTQTQAE